MADPLADERNRVTTHPWLGGALARPEEAAKMPSAVTQIRPMVVT
jgi:hypothetical protein